MNNERIEIFDVKWWMYKIKSARARIIATKINSIKKQSDEIKNHFQFVSLIF